MSKIFRLHAGAAETIEHWHDTGSHLHDTFIASISDPSGSNADTQITSIPSPFARMDLVRTAFKNVNLKKTLDGTTIYHRMISDCLDVGEIFFNIEALGDKVEILEWNSGIMENGGELAVDPNSELGRLLGSGNPKHRLLGETLKMYLFQDRKAFNFAALKRCYLLNYKHGPEIINIIGGTSPATLFFSSANDLSFADIVFGNDTVFDRKYSPLYKRGREYIRYIYAFQAAFPGFSERFPDFHTYLELTFEQLDDSLKKVIRGLDQGSYQSDYNKITVGDAAGNNAEILGFPLLTKNYGVLPTADDNDFLIEASKSVDGLMPCVLPNEPFSETLKYAGGTWQSNFFEKVPFTDERALKDRTLPNQSHIRYPYLTVSDFLEPYLIKLPFPLDEKKFFHGNYEYKSGEMDHGYVLPLKKAFFTYFTISDLQGTVSDGKKRFELQQLPGGIKAILRVPIKNNRYIQFSRIYTANQFQDRIQKADEKANQGVIVENQFTLAIYPFLRPAPEINPHYRILLVDRDVHPLTKHHNYTLRFFSEVAPDTALPGPAPKLRNSKHHNQKVTTSYHVVEQGFDLIEVTNASCSGLLIPLFRTPAIPHRAFKFAIDFGTTNTHVEYKMGNEDPKPFDITEKDIQVGSLHSSDEEAVMQALSVNQTDMLITDLIDIIREEFMPFLIQSAAQYKFPQRTVVGDNGSFNPDEATFALADFNIPFWYLKEDRHLGIEITPNLKWIDFKSNKRFQARTYGFLQQILLMIRNKVLLNGGDLAATEIVWFYPSSMPKYKRGLLQSFWSQYYTLYFPGATKLNRMSESFAPFYYYFYKEGVKPHDRPAVSIDIGGGTTDIVIYQGDSPILLTSFRFAANSIFGDGNGSTSADNGFVQRYERIIRESLGNTAAGNLMGIYDDLKRKNSSSVELIEFFFSLEDNKEVKDKRLTVAFSKILMEDNEFKLVFVFFYAALIYHIAKLMKAKGQPIPDYITFSGNGSKVIRLTDGDAGLSTLLAYTKVIFEDVYQVEQAPPIEFRFASSPKEITCKGGLECTNFARFEEMEGRIRTVLVGSPDEQTVPPASLHYTQLEDPAVIEGVCSEVSGFIDRFFGWNARFNYYQNFGISPKNFPDYKALLNSKIKVDLISGIKAKKEEVQEDQDIDIEETLFFYPLLGALNRLAFRMHKDSKA